MPSGGEKIYRSIIRAMAGKRINNVTDEDNSSTSGVFLALIAAVKRRSSSSEAI